MKCWAIAGGRGDNLYLFLAEPILRETKKACRRNCPQAFQGSLVLMEAFLGDVHVSTSSLRMNRLNPCYNGTVLTPLFLEGLGEAPNPCSNGRISRSSLWHCHEFLILNVLILVLLELFWLPSFWRGRGRPLILVLMEDTLGGGKLASMCLTNGS